LSLLAVALEVVTVVLMARGVVALAG